MRETHRKQIRLPNFDYSSQGAYFVTICTHGRIPLFGQIVPDSSVGAALCGRPNAPDAMIAKWLLEIEHKFIGVSLDTFCIMPDHVHFILLISSGDSTLSHIVGWFKSMTTNEYIRGVRKGLYAPFQHRFWQRNYYEHIIRNEQDLSETRAYIAANPHRQLERKP